MPVRVGQYSWFQWCIVYNTVFYLLSCIIPLYSRRKPAAMRGGLSPGGGPANGGRRAALFWCARRRASSINHLPQSLPRVVPPLLNSAESSGLESVGVKTVRSGVHRTLPGAQSSKVSSSSSSSSTLAGHLRPRPQKRPPGEPCFPRPPCARSPAHAAAERTCASGVAERLAAVRRAQAAAQATCANIRTR